MNRSSKEIECIARLDELTSSNDTILEFLKLESLISPEETKAWYMAQDRAKWLWLHLGNLSKANKLQLLEYKWEVLPVERLKLYIVTDRNSKEFSYDC